MFHTVHCVSLQVAGGNTLKVNPVLVGSVGVDPDRKNRVYVTIGGVKERVVGTEAEVLAALGWTPAEPAAPPPVSTKPPESELPPAATPPGKAAK